jgi:hypothetical protein
VILGVYLAFFINEQAKKSQDRSESFLLMTSLVNDFEQDIQTYEKYQIPVNTQIQQEVSALIDMLSTGSIEDIEKNLSSILQVENFSPTVSTYSSMKLSGKLRLIEDLDLQKKLTSYYEGLVIESTRKDEYQVNFFTNELMSWLTDNVDLMEMKLFRDDDLVTLRNKLIIYGSLIEQKVTTYEMIVEDSESLKTQIESILVSK